MEKKKDNPYVSIHTCKAYRQGFEKGLESQREFLEEKIRSLKNVIVASVGTCTTILAILQVLLSLRQS